MKPQVQLINPDNMRNVTKTEEASGKKVLLFFGFSRLDEMLRKGNVWYVRHYESYFDRVFVVYLSGEPHEPVVRGKTTLISLGTGNGFFNLLYAPFRLLAFARARKATSFLTADIVFSWWTGLLLRWVAGARVVLAPVCIPEEIYRSTGRSLSGLPIAIERLLLRLSYGAAERIIMGVNSDASLAWLRSGRSTRRKLHVVPATVEEFPSPDFYEALNRIPFAGHPVSDPARLLYVGRLHHEKLVQGLPDLLAQLVAQGTRACLVIAGDGPERPRMEALAKELGVDHLIEWKGFVPNADLVDEYRRADVFLSTVTGTALREAGLCGLPVVAYEVDWARHLLKHERTALLVPPGDARAMAQAVRRVLTDAPLRLHIADSFAQEARQRWNSRSIGTALQHTYEEVAAR